MGGVDLSFSPQGSGSYRDGVQTLIRHQTPSRGSPLAVTPLQLYNLSTCSSLEDTVPRALSGASPPLQGFASRSPSQLDLPAPTLTC